jgi:hypothetical protein
LRSALYHNNGDGTFTDVTEKAGVGGEGHYGQGVAVGDYNNDGDIDIAINNRGDYPELLRNDGGNANRWLEVPLIGAKSNRHGIGSSLKLTSEGVAHIEQSKGGMSYMSANDPRIHFGLWEARQDRVSGNHLAERACGSTDECAYRPDHRRQGGHRNCAAQLSKGTEPMKRNGAAHLTNGLVHSRISTVANFVLGDHRL